MIEKTYTVQEVVKIIGLDKKNVLAAISKGELAATRLRDRAPWTITERALNNFKNKRASGYWKEF